MWPRRHRDLCGWRGWRDVLFYQANTILPSDRHGPTPPCPAPDCGRAFVKVGRREYCSRHVVNVACSLARMTRSRRSRAERIVMAKRRGRGEGSIRERADGRWEVRIDLGRGLDGKRRTKSAFAPTQADAVQQLKQLNGRAVDGQVLATSTPTVKAFLADWLATDTANGDVARRARAAYQSAIDLYLVPAFGNRRLEQLTPAVGATLVDRPQERRTVPGDGSTLAHAVCDRRWRRPAGCNSSRSMRRNS